MGFVIYCSTSFILYNIIGIQPLCIECLTLHTNHTVAFIRPESHTLPVGLQSLDGSDTNGGCRQECLMGNICGECTGNTQLNSTLVDGVYPRGTIDTAQPDWAMDFFTINRNGDNCIRIGFDFFDPFILRGVELKLFNCESLGTAVPNFNVYTSLLFPTFLPPSSAPGPIGTYETTASDLDCTSLTTITIPTNPSTMFRFYFIKFSFFQVDSNSAVYVAEIRFVVDNPVVVPNEITTSAPQLLYTTTAGMLYHYTCSNFVYLDVNLVLCTKLQLCLCAVHYYTCID